MNKNFMKSPTLCWDCAKALGGCSWSDFFIPVDGWEARKFHKDEASRPDHESYFVYQCPEFQRDSLDGGRVRYTKKTDS